MSMTSTLIEIRKQFEELTVTVDTVEMTDRERLLAGYELNQCRQALIALDCALRRKHNGEASFSNTAAASSPRS
jgi:hypothetical protein